jgi:hypothetical protein
MSISAPRSLPRDIGGPGVAIGGDGTLAFFSGRIAIRRPDGRWKKTRTLSDRAYALESARVVIDPFGGMTVAWIRSCRASSARSCGGRKVVQARSRSARGRWGPIETLGRVGYDPALALCAEARGGATVAWHANNAVNVARHATGQRFGRVMSFRRNGPEDGGTTALATSADGRAYIAFATAPPSELEHDIPQSFVAVAARSRHGRWSAPQQASDRPAAQPRVTVAADGAVVVAWRESSFNADDMPRYGGVGAAIGTADGRFAAPQHVADARTTGLLLGAGNAGDTVLAWSSPTDTTGPLDYAVRAAKAAGFGAVRRAPGVRADLTSSQGAFAILDDGTALFAGPPGIDGAVRIAIRPPAGRFARAQLVLPHAHDPIIAATGSRAALVYRQPDEVSRFVTLSRR